MVVLLEGLIVNFDIRRVEVDLSAGKEVLGFFLHSNFDSDNNFATPLIHCTRIKVSLVFEVHMLSEMDKEGWKFVCGVVSLSVLVGGMDDAQRLVE